MITASSTCAKHLGTTLRLPNTEIRLGWGAMGSKRGPGRFSPRSPFSFAVYPSGREPFLAERKGCLYCPISRSSKLLFFHHLVEENPLIRNI